MRNDWLIPLNSSLMFCCAAVEMPRTSFGMRIWIWLVNILIMHQLMIELYCEAAGCCCVFSICTVSTERSSVSHDSFAPLPPVATTLVVSPVGSPLYQPEGATYRTPSVHSDSTLTMQSILFLSLHYFSKYHNLYMELSKCQWECE